MVVDLRLHKQEVGLLSVDLCCQLLRNILQQSAARGKGVDVSKLRSVGSILPSTCRRCHPPFELSLQFINLPLNEEHRRRLAAGVLKCWFCS